ncbi:hypothetical protein Vafri_3454 [Volvox africanus]|nr:hypothetical protein Vafri_3454 [Volvox africanus]
MPKESLNNTDEMTGKRVLDAGYLYEMRTKRGVSSSRAQVAGAGYDSFFVNPLAMGSHDGGMPIVYAGAALAATSVGILGKGFNNPLAFECSDGSFSEFDSSPGIETCTLLPCVGVDCSHAEGCDFRSSYPVPPETPLHDIKFEGELCPAVYESAGNRQLPPDAASRSASCEDTLGLKPLARSGSGSRAAVADEFTAGLLQAPGQLEQQQSTHACSIPSGLNSSRRLPDAPLLSQGGAAGNSCEYGQAPPFSAEVTGECRNALSSSDSGRAAAEAGPLGACVGIAEEEPCSCPWIMRVQLATSQEPIVLSPETPIDNEPNRTNLGVESLPEQQELDIEEEGPLLNGSDVAAAAMNGTSPSDGFAPGTPPLGARDGGSATAGPGIMPPNGRESRPHCELGDRQAWSDRGEGDVELTVMQELRMGASLPPQLQAPAQPLLDLAQEPHQRDASKSCTLPRPLYSLPVYLDSNDTVEEGGQVVQKPETAVSLFRTLPVTKSTSQSAAQEQGSCASFVTSVRNGILVAATNPSTSLGSLPSLLLPTVPIALMWPHLVPLLAKPSKGDNSEGVGNRTGSGSSGVDSIKFGLPAAQPMRPDTPEVAEASRYVLLPDPGCSISGLAMTRLLIRHLGLLPETPPSQLLESQLPSAGGQIVPSPFATAMDAAASALHITSPIPAEQSGPDLGPIEDEEDGFGDDHEAVSISCTLKLQFKGISTVTDADVSSLAAKFQPPADAVQEIEQWDPEVAEAGAVAGATDAASMLSSSESSSIFDGRGSSVLRGALSVASMQEWLEPQDWKPLREKYCGAQIGVLQASSA